MSLLVRYLLSFCLLLCSPALLAFDQFETFSEDGKYGLINTETEEVVLEARYEAVGWSDKSFSIAANTIGVQQNGKWAIASVEGELVTSHLYTVLYPFTDGLLIAGKRSRFSILNKTGVVSVKGKEVVPLEFDQVRPAGSQLIVGTLHQGEYQYGLISRSGKTVIEQIYTSIEPIEEKTFSVKNEEGFSAIFSDNGQQLSPFEFENIVPFDSKRLLITYYNRKGLVDKTGKVALPPVYKEIRLNNGQIRAQPFKKWTFFGADPESKTLFFDRVLPLTSEVFAIQTNNNIGLITEKEAYISYHTNMQLVSASHGLLIVTNGQYQGVLNTQGQFVLPLNYDRVTILPEVVFGEIRRQNNQNWQAFDHRGVLQSRQYYESFEQVSDTRLVAGRNGKLGLLDVEGNEKTPFIYDSIGHFTNQMAVVRYQGNHGVINNNGYWVITPYKDSLALHKDFVYYRHGTENGLMDFNEKVTFRTQDRLTPLSRSLLVRQDEDGYELVDGNGVPALDRSYDSVQVVHKDLLALKKDDKYWLFRPSTGQLQQAPEDTEAIGRYAEDLIAIKLDGQWGFIGEQVRLRIANRYEEVRPFSEGLSVVKLIGKWGVIDKQENIIIQPTYDSVGSFYGGLALVQKNGLFGMVNREGKLVLDVKYNHVDRQEKYIILESAGLFGLADKRGSIVRNPQFDSIKYLDDQHFLLSKAGKLGVVSINGEDKVPVAFETVSRIGNTFLAAEPSQWIKAKFQ